MSSVASPVAGRPALPPSEVRAPSSRSPRPEAAEPPFRPPPPLRGRSTPSRRRSDLGRRPRLGGGATGLTRACTRASPRMRPNRPALGSLSTTNSASSSATPRRSRTISLASGSVFPLASTHSTCYRAFLSRFALERGCSLGWAAAVGICFRGVRPVAVGRVPRALLSRSGAGTRALPPARPVCRSRLLALGRLRRGLPGCAGSARPVAAVRSWGVLRPRQGPFAPINDGTLFGTRSGRRPGSALGPRSCRGRRGTGHDALPEQDLLREDTDGTGKYKIDIQNSCNIKINEPEDEWHVFLDHCRLRICLRRLRVSGVEPGHLQVLQTHSRGHQHQVGDGRRSSCCGGTAAFGRSPSRRS